MMRRVLSLCEFATPPWWLGFLSMIWLLICNVHSEITILALMVHNLRDSTQKDLMYSYSQLHRSSAAIVSMSWDLAQRDAVQMCVHADLELNVLELRFKVTCRHIFESHKRKPALPFVLSLLLLSFVFYNVVFLLILACHSHTRLETLFLLLINLDVKACSCALNFPL